VEQPPADPDAWTHEQWIEWLDATDTGPDATPRVYAPKVASSGGVILGAAMMGLHRAVYGDAKKPEIVVEAEADGKDDGMKIDLDPDDPTHSTVVVNPPRP
jgi:hypothetical protein